MTEDQPITPDIELTVVVVSHNRPDDLRLCLADLAAQETRVRFEVLVVLQAYPDGFGAELQGEFGDALNLVVSEHREGLGVHGARNEAIKHVRGEIVAFVDDDCRIPRHWVESLPPYYADPSIGGVGGYVNHPGRASLPRKVFYTLFGMNRGHYVIDWGGFHSGPSQGALRDDREADWLSGCNMSFRSSVIDQVGEFDESYGKYGYDDVDYGLRVRQAGWRLVTAARLTVDHFCAPLNRADPYTRMREDEAGRVLLVRKAIGGRRFWKVRYTARLAIHLVFVALIAAARRQPRLPIYALRGSAKGLRAFGTRRGPASSGEGAPAGRG